MKTIKSIIIPALTLITVTSCNTKVRVNTVINEDGTCCREVSYYRQVEEKNLDNYKKGLLSDTAVAPIPQNICVDGMVKGESTLNKDTLTITFRKDYESVEEMPMPILHEGKVLKSKPRFEKKFKWFYTKYTYTETFEGFKDKLPIPIDQITGKDTVSYWFTGSPDIIGRNITGAEVAEKIEVVKNKVNRWVDDNITQIVFTAIADQYDSIKSAPLTKEEFINSCDSFKAFLFNSDKHYFAGDLNFKPNEVFKDFYKTDAYDIFFDDDNPSSKLVSSKVMEFIRLFDWEISYTIQMPGLICADRQMAEICENKVLFTISGEKLLAGDYTISVTTRKTNTWAFLVTGIIIVIAIGSFIYGRKKK